MTADWQDSANRRCARHWNGSHRAWRQLLLALAAVAASGCGSTNKSWTARTYQNFHAYFNGYFHARQRYREAVRTQARNLQVPPEGFLPLVDALVLDATPGSPVPNPAAGGATGPVLAGANNSTLPGAGALQGGSVQGGNAALGLNAPGPGLSGGVNMPGNTGTAGLGVPGNGGGLGTGGFAGNAGSGGLANSGLQGNNLGGQSFAANGNPGGVAGGGFGASGGGFGTANTGTGLGASNAVNSPGGVGLVTPGAGMGSGAASAGFSGFNSTQTNAAAFNSANYPNDPTTKGTLLEQAIRKAEVMIFRRPTSRWVDDARLLIAKAYFAQNKLGDALQVLEAMPTTYPKSELLPEVYLWQAKIQERYGNAVATRQLLDRALKLRDVPPAVQSTASLLYGQMLIEQGEYQRATQVLEASRRSFDNRMDRARVAFVLGQLYEQIGNPRQALLNYDEVLALGVNDALDFRATLNRLALLGKYKPTDRKVPDPEITLNDMARTGRFAPFSPTIYNTLGQLEENRRNPPKAIKAYERAVVAARQYPDALQRTRAFHALGRLAYANQRQPVRALAYYDSASVGAPDGYAGMNDIRAMQMGLRNYVQFQRQAHTQDSLLALAALSPADVERRVEASLKAEEARAFAARVAAENARRQQANAPAVQTDLAGFYFDDPARVAQGLAQFQRIWGDRPNVDNWRWRSRMRLGGPQANVPDASADSVDAPPRELTRSERADALRKAIPLDAKAKAAAEQQLADAWHGLMGVFTDQWPKPDSAAAYGQRIIDRFPGSAAAQRAHYALYRLWRNRLPSEAKRHADILQQDYPTCEFARLIRNEGKTGTLIESGDFDNAYTVLLGLYQAGDYARVRTFAEYLRNTYPDHPEVPRLYYLEGMSWAQQNQRDSLQRIFQHLVQTFPGTEPAKEAQRTLDALQPQVTDASGRRVPANQVQGPIPVEIRPFVVERAPGETVQAVLLVPFSISTSEQIKQLLGVFHAKHFAKDQLRTEVFTMPGRHLVFTNPFPSYTAGKAYLDKLQADPVLRRLLGTKPEQAVALATTNNFRQAFTTGRLDEYVQFYQATLADWLAAEAKRK